MAPPASVEALLRETAAWLAAAGVERPRWTAAQLAAAVLECEPVALIVEPPAIGPEAAGEVRRRVTRRAHGVPLQHLTGVAGFFGHDFHVAPGVFIPRPETERVVETALRELARVRRTWPRPTVVDVGTGSGAIAISLTSTSDVSTIGFDTNPQALGVAQRNARRLGVAARTRWVRADLLAACADTQVDLVVANLPYLPSSTLSTLPREVQWDPGSALDGGPDGLDLIRRLVAQAAARLRLEGVVILEVGAGQAGLLRRAYAAQWETIDVVLDDTGIERVVVMRRPRASRG